RLVRRRARPPSRIDRSPRQVDRTWRGDLNFLVVRRSQQQNWEFAIRRHAVSRRAVNVSGQPYAIAHSDHDIFRFGHLVERLCLRSEWQSRDMWEKQNCEAEEY